MLVVASQRPSGQETEETYLQDHEGSRHKHEEGEKDGRHANPCKLAKANLRNIAIGLCPCSSCTRTKYVKAEVSHHRRKEGKANSGSESAGSESVRE